MRLGKDAVAMQVSLPKPVDGAALLKVIEPWLKPVHADRCPRWPGTVLVVEDEPKLHQLLRDFLQLHGFTAAAVPSGEEAMRYLAQTPASVVLLDIKMPGMDGLLTLKKIKALRGSTTVIIITALEDDTVAADAFVLGAADFILKPFNLDYLETVLLSKLLLGDTP
jgi:DNA-binding NtrC family response regulator